MQLLAQDERTWTQKKKSRSKTIVEGVFSANNFDV